MRRATRTGWTWAFWALIAALWILPVASGMLSPWVALGQLALTTLVLFGLVITHELGHAVLGRLLGYRIFEVSIGTGWPSADAVLGRTRVRLAALPIGGHTWLAPTGDRVLAAREVFVSLAGPAVNLVILGVALVSDWPEQLRVVVILMSGILVLENLWPREVANPLGTPVSDGLRAARALDLDDDGMRQLLASRYLGESYVDHARGDHTAAAAWSARGLEAFPGLAALEGDVATSLVLQGRFTEGRDALRRHLARNDLDPLQRALYENNLAWADLMLGDPALEAEALERSAAAFAVLPTVPAVRGTRGLALILGGAVDEGIALCGDAYRGHREPAARAANAASMAIGATRQGRIAAAERHLRQAIRLDPHGVLIDHAGDELRAARRVAGA